MIVFSSNAPSTPVTRRDIQEGRSIRSGTLENKDFFSDLPDGVFFLSVFSFVPVGFGGGPSA